MLCPTVSRSRPPHHTLHTAIHHSPFCPLYPGSIMASIPQTLQLTKTQHRQQRRGRLNPEQGSYFQNAELEQPMRYSSKLMNSIWGQYNENSVHNFKSLQCGGVAAPDTQETQQQLQDAPSTTREVFQQRLGELGTAVAANFMDNLHQY